MQRKLLIIIVSIFTLFHSERANSQIDTTKYNDVSLSQLDTVLKKNTVFVEIGGNGLVYSINYDRLINVSSKIKISTRIGVHYTNYFPLIYYRTVSIPIEVSALYPFFRNKHFLEIGSGLSYLNSYDKITNYTEDILILALRLGYRYQKPQEGLFIKIGFVPLYDFYVINPDPSVPHQTWFLSGGVGIGKTF